YMLWKDAGETLPDYLDNKVFAEARSSTLMADAADIEGFNAFLAQYKKALPLERTATEVF
ncbi:MAG: ATPase, partial [Clostridia bacterium]|nr:ATPase [Clostridia bacterium]